MKNTKKVVALFLATIVIAMSFSSCGAVTDLLGSITGGGSDSVKYKKIGQRVSTTWFDFTVNSAEFVSEYEGAAPSSGNDFLVVELSEKCTWDSTTPFYTGDYFVDEENFPDYVWGMDAFTDEMRPDEFDLAPNESLQSVMVFEVPKDTDLMYFVYVEVSEDQSEGKTFAIAISR